MKYALYCCLLVTSLTACAQAKYGIVKSYAFYQQSSPGNIAVNDEGVEQPIIATTYSVFLETKNSAAPVWKKAWVHGSPYDVTATIMATPYIVGKRKDTEEQVTLVVKQGNHLLQLGLEKTDQAAMPVKAGKLNKAGSVVLQGTYRGKPVFWAVEKIAQLSGPEFQ